MASLVEELINVLTEEEKVYRTLAANGEKKRQIIMPEISGEAVAVCHLDKAVQCLIKLRLICAHILTEPAVF